MRRILALLAVAAMAAILLLDTEEGGQEIVAAPAGFATSQRHAVPAALKESPDVGESRIAYEDAEELFAAGPVYPWVGHPVDVEGVPLLLEAAKFSIHHPVDTATGFLDRPLFKGDISPDGKFRAELPPGEYQLRVFQIPGTTYRHLPQWIELSTRAQSDEPGAEEVHDEEAAEDDSARTFEDNVPLVPRGFVAVFVETDGSQSFNDVARQLNIPADAFFAAFRAVATRDHMPVRFPWLRYGTAEAIFYPSPYALAGDHASVLIGFLELEEEPPLGIGLWFDGLIVDHSTYGDERLELLAFLSRKETPWPQQVVFRLGADLLATRLARGAEAGGSADARDLFFGSPLALQSSPDEEPAGPALHRARPRDRSHAAGDPLYLDAGGGDLVRSILEARPGLTFLDAGPSVVIRAVDEDGKPFQAIVEVARYEEGADVRELFPRFVKRVTDAAGQFALRQPSDLVVVRTRRYEGDPPRPSAWAAGNSTLLDPASLPNELVLVEAAVRGLRLAHTTPWSDEDRLTVEDELNLIVSRPDPDKRPYVGLHPGTYLVRRWRGEEELGRAVTIVDAESRNLAVP